MSVLTRLIDTVNTTCFLSSQMNHHMASRRFSLLRTFVPSFLFVSISLVFLTVVVFETDWPALRVLKRKPELLSLHYHYYNPLKEYLKRKLIELF